MRSYRQFIIGARESPTIVAHRGAWNSAPENSVAAITAAADAGYEIVEIDARPAADGGFFLLHDPTLDRTTGRRGTAEDLSLADLTATTLRERDGGADAQLTGHTIPTLTDALRAARGRVYLDIDVKHERDLEKVASLVAAEGMTDHVDIKIDVSTLAHAAHLRALQQKFGILVMPKMNFRAAIADDLMAIVIATEAPLVEVVFDALGTLAERAETFREAGIDLWVNTLDPVACCGFADSRAVADPQAIWGALVAAGVSVVQTDRPEELLSYRESVGQAGG